MIQMTTAENTADQSNIAIFGHMLAIFLCGIEMHSIWWKKQVQQKTCDRRRESETGTSRLLKFLVQFSYCVSQLLLHWHSGRVAQAECCLLLYRMSQKSRSRRLIFVVVCCYTGGPRNPIHRDWFPSSQSSPKLQGAHCCGEVDHEAWQDGKVMWNRESISICIYSFKKTLTDRNDTHKNNKIS